MKTILSKSNDVVEEGLLSSSQEAQYSWKCGKEREGDRESAQQYDANILKSTACHVRYGHVWARQRALEKRDKRENEMNSKAISMTYELLV